MEFQFRAEFFNLLNNVNFTVPGLGSANPGESAAGNIVGTSASLPAPPTRAFFNSR